MIYPTSAVKVTRSVITKELVFNTSEVFWRRRLSQMQESIETMHSELEERLRFETLLAETSSRFINVPADQVDKEIEGAQRRICEFLNLDRSSLGQVFPTGRC